MDDIGVRIVEAKLKELRPTQMPVGYDEVAFRRHHWRVLTGEEKNCFICKHPFPAVLGPRRPYYILDGHHLGRALLEEGVEGVLISPVENLSHLDQAEFWRVMARRNLIYPFAQGRRRGFSDMPKTLRELVDDPFRSLTARIHRACQYEKDPAPFAEFQSIFFEVISRLPRSEPILSESSEYARKLLRDRASTYFLREGTGSIPPARVGRPRCHNSRRSCEDCPKGEMAGQMA